MRLSLLALLLLACDPPKDTGVDSTDLDDSDSLPPDSAETGETGETGDPLPLGSVSGTATVLLSGAEILSFGVPIPRGDVDDLTELRVAVDGLSVPFQAAEVFSWWDAEGTREGARVVLVQLDATLMSSDTAALEISWGLGLPGEPPGTDVIDPQNDEVSDDVEETVRQATRTIAEVDGAAALVETETWEETQYTARQPRVLVVLDLDAWTGSEALGRTPPPSSWSGLGMGGLSPLGDALQPFMSSAAQQQDYALNPNGTLDPTDPLQYEFGRCSTMIQAALLSEDAALLAESHRLCAWYGENTESWAASLGLWTLNDPVSGLIFHARDLFEFATISGDWSTVDTHARVAQAWMEAPLVEAYREGRVEGDLWMEQFVGTAAEGIWYGWLATGDTAMLDAMEELVAAIHTHVTGTDEQLAAMGVGFPSQGCMVHTEKQHDESLDEDSPWCSPWQTATLVDPLTQYRELTGDGRVDEIFLALGRYLRDTGTHYTREERWYCDSFMEPYTCYDATEGAPQRVLTAVYGAARDADGERVLRPDYGEFAHCPDISALAAASYAAILRNPDWDQGAVGPFDSETESLRVLHQELAACANWVTSYYHRERRNPSYWTAELLAEGLTDPDAFIARYKIGYPDYVAEPLRMPSWWFNAGLGQIATLLDAGVTLDVVEGGQLDPEECADTGSSLCP